MARARTHYLCTECGAAAPKWGGQCAQCGAWNTLVESVVEAQAAARAAVPAAPVRALDSVEATDHERRTTGIEEFDRVLGGGLVTGGVVLLGGDPGIGKSTLLLQALAAMGARHRVLYVSGEESAAQVALRARRLGVAGEGVRLVAETNLEAILATIAAESPAVVVIDSIQTVQSMALESAPGSVAQVRECAAQLTRLAKRGGIGIVLIGHVTKEGTLAGPRVLEHLVDTVLYFEGDTHSTYRLVRAFKNRYGAVNEIGVFAMTERGLRGVANPSALFLSQYGADGKGGTVAGSCVLVTQEGTRPLLVEIQALVDSAHIPNPRRLCVGLDPQRLAMLLAVLHRHAGIVSFDQDVFVNAVGGVRIDEPAADLAVLLAIVSSIRDRPVPRGLVVFGEIGLAGEVRQVGQADARLKEALRLGFQEALLPARRKGAGRKTSSDGLTLREIDRLGDLVELLTPADRNPVPRKLPRAVP